MTSTMRSRQVVPDIYYTAVMWAALFLAIMTSGTSGRTVYSDEMTSKCGVLPDTFICSDLYNHTVFPNHFGHQNIQDVQSAINDFVPLIQTRCSKILKQFLCFVFAPPCTVLEIPLRPCKQLCMEAVTQQCRDILTQHNKNPEVLLCNKYPEVGSMCIYNNTMSENGGSKTRETTMGTNGDSEESGTTVITRYPYKEGPFTDNTSLESKEVDLDLHLLVTNGNRIQLLQIRTYNSMDSITVHRDDSDMTSIAYYQPSEYFYWSRKLERKIYRGKLVMESLEDTRPIVAVDSSVESIVVDWNLRVLFWLESYPKARLKTSSLSGRMVTTLVSREMYSPISLTSDPTQGLLFWINKRGPVFEQFSTIEKYSVVSERRTVLFNISSSTITDGGRPQAIVADVMGKRLFWLDASSKSLHTIKYDGTGHRTLLFDHKRLSDPESLAVHGEHVLWTDRKTSAIIWVNKRTGKDELIVKTFDTTPPQNIKMFGRSELSKKAVTYDKSALAEKWRELSSKENMEVYEYDDLIDRDIDDVDDDVYCSPTCRKRQQDKQNSAPRTLSRDLFNCLCLSIVTSLILGLRS